MTAIRPLLPELDPPWDAEVDGLAAGRRRLVKREFASPADRRAADARGLLVADAGGRYGHAPDSAEVRRGTGDSTTLLFARDADTLAEALALERIATSAAGHQRRIAESRLGALLGYPGCCIHAHANAQDQGEDACFRRLLAEPDPDGLPAGNNLFVLSHQLISHFPCSLRCDASRALADAALAALTTARPEHGRALGTLLASPITVWDRFRFLIEHPTRGPLTAESLTHAERLLTHPPYLAFRAALPDLPAGGTRLRFVRVE